MRVPMLIMSTKFFNSKMAAVTPANKPDTTVAFNGVWNVGLT